MRILGADGLTGNDKALDNITSSYLKNGDMCLAKYPETNGASGKVYFYILLADQGGAENLPNIVVPRDNATTPTDKRWVLTGVYQDEITAFNIYANTLSQASSGVPLVISDTLSFTDGTATFNNTSPTKPFGVDSSIMVDNLNAEYWGGIHWSVFDLDELIKSGDQWISAGVETLAVTFPAPQFDDTYSLFTELHNDTDSNPSFYNIMVTSKTTVGFTVKFSGQMDSAYYRLQWAILGNNSYFELFNLRDVNGDDLADVIGDLFTVL